MIEIKPTNKCKDCEHLRAKMKDGVLIWDFCYHFMCDIDEVDDCVRWDDE